MTDRELLELAAKAAGLVVRWHDASCFGPTMEIMEGEEGGPPWNPLTNQEDADCLADQLDLDVERLDGNSTIAGNLLIEKWPHEPDGDDHAAAARRAIVRAAAEIGRTQPPAMTGRDEQ